MSISHLILTRFNLQYEQNKTNAIQPEWLDERLHLFEQYCIPSIQKQTCKNFTWIVLGDVRTPNVYKTKIEKYASIVAQMRIYWVAYQDDGYHALYKRIGEDLAADKEALISTRLDNDDAIAPNYIECVQELVQNDIDEIISFPLGRQIFIKDNKSYLIRYPQNHFTSRVEHGTFNTILAFDHTKIKTTQLHLIDTPTPMWEEFVHGGNVSNDYMPQYHYYINNWADRWDLTIRWVRFQKNRLLRLIRKLLFVFMH